MKTVRAAMIAVLFFLAAGTAMADSVPGNDPSIGVKGGHHTVSTLSEGFNFSFTVDAMGGGIFDLVNNTDVTWTTLVLTATAPLGSTFQCNGFDLFRNCTVNSTGQNGDGTEGVLIQFFGVSEGFSSGTGIPPGGQFFFDLNDDFNCNVECVGGWTPGSTVNGTANAVITPEPASIFLVLTGLGGIVARRRRNANLAERS